MLLTRTLIALLVVSGLPVTAVAAGGAGLAQPGAVVVEAPKGSVAQRAGLEPGDVILSWSRAATPPANPKAASGSVRDPFDLEDVEVEQASRGPMTLQGLRGKEKKVWVAPPGLPPGPWGMKTRPRLAGRLLALYEEGRGAIGGGQVAQGVEKWMAAAASAREAGVAAPAVWFLARSASASADARQWKEADSGYAAAVDGAGALGRPGVGAQILREWGEGLERRDVPRAEASYRKALGEDEKAGPETLAVALDVTGVGSVLYGRDLDTVEALFKRALAIREKAAPGSRELATTLNNLGLIARDRRDFSRAEALLTESLAIFEKDSPRGPKIINALANLASVALRRGDAATSEAHANRLIATQEADDPNGPAMVTALFRVYNLAAQRGDLTRAEEYAQRCLVLVERLDAGSRDHGGALNNLGNLAMTRGDLPAAEGYLQRAVEVWSKSFADSLPLAGGMSNLGNVMSERGDLAAAEEQLKKALAIRERQEPGSIAVAASYNNLGDVAHRRGDLEANEEYLKRAIAILEKLAPGSDDLADNTNNLGIVAYEREDWAAAEELFRKAYETYRTLAPRSAKTAKTLNAIASAVRGRGDLAAARQLHGEALALSREVAPRSLQVALISMSLGNAERDAGELAKARERFQEALEIRRRLAPGSWEEADSIHGLGLASRQERRPDARPLLCEAVDVLERQKARLGGTEEARGAFSAKFADYYHDCLEALLHEGKPAEAFRVLERSRARALLALLAERDILFSADVPPELAREVRLNQAEYDQAQADLAKLDAGEATRALELQTRVRAAAEAREAIGRRIREVAPRLAALQRPEPLDLDGVRALLEPGTVLLSYSVGKESSVLFVVRPGAAKGHGLTAHTIPAGTKLLREKVQGLRRLAQRTTTPDAKALGQLGTELYALLMQPAEPALAAAERLVVSPDGPLHTLPFALLRPGPVKGRPARYLGQRTPMVLVASGTLYGELRKARRERPAGDGMLVAFGDPRYPGAKDSPSTEPEVRSAASRGLSFVPLPSSRREVEQIASLFAGSATIHLGEGATEEKAKAVSREVRYLHFATHGFVDDRLPLNSALALSIPERPADGQDNGLLQAWEVFDRVRLDADLITLSACETGLGREMGGEGLFGLTRAFLYAGARSVLASLWSVSDESTAELMRRFYGYLKAGRPKAEALRLAQVDLSADPRFADPFHWAAFELVGDWR